MTSTVPDRDPRAWRIAGGRVLGPEGFHEGPLVLAEGLIADAERAEARPFDAAGLLVLPGIVDIHGDAFERQIMPRPGVGFGLELALMESDRQLIANGITTAYHGLSISWEPGLRSLEAAKGFVEVLERLRPGLASDNRLHLRWETFALEAVPTVEAWLALQPAPILAFNDHTTPFFAAAPRVDKLASLAQRAGLDEAGYRALADGIWARRDEVPAAKAHLAGVARSLGAGLLAHDEMTPQERAVQRRLGVRVSEFPLDRATAEAARAAGEAVVMGAPNVVRGGSHLGAVDAADAVGAGICSVLASDYYYPAPLIAAFKLAAEGRLPLPEAWALVSANAAEAAGLDDRGSLAPGKRADLILVDPAGPLPRVVAAFVAGRKVYEAV